MPIKAPTCASQKLIVMFILVVGNGICMDFEKFNEAKGTGNDKSSLNSHKGALNQNGHSFFLGRLNKSPRFSKLDGSNDDEKPSEGTKTTSTKFIIPNEGGLVIITRRPKRFLERVRRFSENQTVEVEASTKVNSNSVDIPNGGGPVHIDFPDYVKYGITKKKAPEERVTANFTRNDLGKIMARNPGDDSDVRKSEDLTQSAPSEDVTQIIGKETAVSTSEQPATSIYLGNTIYPFFAAVHAASSGKVSFDNVQCSGGILSKTVVVTSCSCLCDEEYGVPVFMFYYISVGHQKFARINDTQVYFSRQVAYHPSCKKTDAGLWKGNIAMLRIKQPGIKFGEFVQPMNIPKLKMWDASDVLGKMSEQRRHCRVIGWSRKAPAIDTALGRLIPLDECANPVCRKNMPCPRRNTGDGFMVEIIPNEPAVLPGALLYCSGHVFALVNTKRECPTNNVFATCSPEELLFSKYDFELTPEAQEEMSSYHNLFSNSIEGWETYTYPPPPSTSATKLSTSNRKFAEVVSSGSISFPFFPREASWISTYIFVAGYHGFVFT